MNKKRLSQTGKPRLPDKPRRGPASSDERQSAHRAAPETSSPSVIFGVLPVLEALRSNSRRIDKIAIADGAGEHRLSEIVRLARENGVTVNRTPRANFSKYVDPSLNTQGVIAFTSPVDYADASGLIDTAPDNALMLILDGVEDPRNLGAVLRSAECAGVDGVFIPERRAVGLTDTVAKSSAGAIEYVKVAKVANLNRLIEKMKERNIWVIGTSGDAETSYTDWDWTRPSAIVLGAEGSGLHRLVAENCDMLVKIPMYGKIDSLNVSVAAGVIMFEVRRQRSSKKE
ncbi:MAG: 23S rRNA (guanosine(2251)-2'-O)-methyltransferase RlmB [Acidobacteriota bacterium]